MELCGEKKVVMIWWSAQKLMARLTIDMTGMWGGGVGIDSCEICSVSEATELVIFPYAFSRFVSSSFHWVIFLHKIAEKNLHDLSNGNTKDCYQAKTMKTTHDPIFF